MIEIQMKQVTEAAAILRNFIPRDELETILENTKGEEGEFFINKLIELSTLVVMMPQTGDTEGQDAMALLHYFGPGECDWWITEIDRAIQSNGVPGPQHQAFGYARMFQGCGEMGYISIAELLTSRRVELDLYWNPKPISEIREKHP